MKRRAITIDARLFLLVAAMLIAIVSIFSPAAARVAAMALPGTISSGDCAFAFGSATSPELVGDCVARLERDWPIQAAVLCMKSAGGEIALLEPVDTMPAGALGLSARHLILLQTLSRSCPQPLLLDQS